MMSPASYWVSNVLHAGCQLGRDIAELPIDCCGELLPHRASSAAHRSVGRCLDKQRCQLHGGGPVRQQVIFGPRRFRDRRTMAWRMRMPSASAC